MEQVSIDAISEFTNDEIVDVREQEEFMDYNVGGRNIPAHKLNEFLSELHKEKKLLILCSNGLRSSIVARVLIKKLPNTKIYHLSSGIFPEN